jgi:hypothetical protein
MILKLIITFFIFIVSIYTEEFKYKFNPPEYTNKIIEFDKRTESINIDKYLYFIENESKLILFDEVLKNESYKIIRFPP